jgi:hypothetical protein
MANQRCATCYGTGEWVTEQGPAVCPDCFGSGSAPGRGTTMEWRLREIERRLRGSGSDVENDVGWLIHEVRRGRDALLAILARCQDAEDGDVLAADVRYAANQALGLYEELKNEEVES